jgi:hypothetical protein
MPVCSNGHDAPREALWCAACGEDLRDLCTNGHPVSGVDSFCAECGVSVLTSSEDASTPLLMSRDASSLPGAAPDAPASAEVRYPPPTGQPWFPAPSQQIPFSPLSAAPALVQSRPAGTTPAYAFDLSRLNTIDRVTGVSAGILLIALFLPWFGLSGANYSRSGINQHSYLVLVMLTSLALIGYVAARGGWDRVPVRLPIAHAPLLLVIGVFQLFLVLIAFLFGHAGLGHAWGSWVGLLAAAGTCLPIAVPAFRSFRQAR